MRIADDFVGRGLVLVEHPRNTMAIEALGRWMAAGVRVTLLTSDPRKFPIEVTANRGLRLVGVDTNNVDAVRSRLPQHPDMDAIFSYSHHYCQIAAQLASDVGLPASCPASIGACVQKNVMRSVLASTEYSVPYAVARNESQLASAYAKLGPDLILKPVAETSSLGVFRTTGLAAALNAFPVIASRRTNRQGQEQVSQVLVEQYVDGPEFSVELLRYYDGRVRLYGVTRKHPLPAHPLIEQADSFPVKDLVAVGLAKAAVESVAAIGGLYGPLHVEVKMAVDGPRVIEINPRQGGGYIPLLIEAVTGSNIFDDALALLLGGPLSTQPVAPLCNASTWWQLYPERAGTLRALEGLPPMGSPNLLKLDIRATPGQALKRPESNLDSYGSIVVSGTSEEASMATAGMYASQVRTVVV